MKGTGENEITGSIFIIKLYVDESLEEKRMLGFCRRDVYGYEANSY